MKRNSYLLMFAILASAILYLIIYYATDKGVEIFLIPENFKGVAVIIYDVKNGEPTCYENGSRVYKIPKTGFLKTQFSSRKGLRPLARFYYVDITGKRHQIVYSWSWKSDTTTGPQVFAFDNNVGMSHFDNRIVTYESFVVGHYYEAGSLSKTRDDLFIADL